MSDDENSNASGGEEENEEENEEEGEDNAEEGEENEDEEAEDDEERGEENESEEDEEEEDDDKAKKKKKGKKEEKDTKGEAKGSKADDKRPSDKGDNKVVSADDNNLLALSSNFPILPPRPKTVLNILEEINSDMDSLTHELSTVFALSSFSVPYSPPMTHNFDRENEEIKKLIAQASHISTEIDNHLKSHPQSEDKCVGSDEEENPSYQPTFENNSPIYSTEPQAHRSMSPKQYNPYDANRNVEYYNALNNRNRNRTFQYQNNNPFIHQDNYHTLNSTGSNQYQSSRVKKMEDLYQVDNSNKRPIIYSQDRHMGSNNYNMNYQPYQKDYSPNENQKNNNDYIDNQPRPFERYKPQSVSQAMDILLDKQ